MADPATQDQTRRREWMQALRTETEARHCAWKQALEPEDGCSFTVYTENPYSNPDNPEAYLAEIKVSRPSWAKDNRCVRVRRLSPGNRKQLVFGDDEMYVANYQDRKPYNYERPYHYPADPDGLLERPPSTHRISRTSLSKWRQDGCFRCLERGALLTKSRNPLLAARGHPIQAPDFGVAMVYATARRALDIWKVYLNWDVGFEQAVEKPFPWHFRDHFPRLEIVPAIDDGQPLPEEIASSGFGFVQLGCGQRDNDNHHAAPLANADGSRPPAPGPPQARLESWAIPYWINPDVLVHELGHQILYATLGFGPGVGPTVSGPVWVDLWGGRNGDDFRAFHEAFSDIVAVIVSMHHRPFLKAILAATKGDLFSENAATEVGEISARKTIRSTLNNVRLAEAERIGAADANAPSENRYYTLSQVVSGALFDVLAGFSVHYLAEYQHLPADLVREWEQAFDPKRPDGGAGVPEAQLSDEVQAIYALEDGPDIVESAVTRARDALGCLLGSYLAEHSKAGFDPATFRFASLKRDLIAVASRQDSAPSDALARPTLTGATKARVVEQCFTWRGI
jgi:hypothetical protein